MDNLADDFLDRIQEEETCDTRVEPQTLASYITDCCSINLIHFNIRGIATNFNNLLVFLETYKLKSCDFIILSECHKIYNIQNFNIPGYEVYYNEADFNSFDGVIVYYRSHLNPRFNSFKMNRCGITVTTVNTLVRGTEFNIYATYRSPSSSLTLFLEEINIFFRNQKIGARDVFVGDININLLNKNDLNVVNYLSLLNGQGFKALCQKVTREESQTCLDHVFLRESKNLRSNQQKLFIIEHDISDHLPLMLHIPVAQAIKYTSSDRGSGESQGESLIDFQKLLSLAAEMNWDSVVTEPIPENATDCFLKNIQEILKLSEKKINSCKKEKIKKLKPWITSAIINSIKRRDKLKKALKNNKVPERINEYRDYRNRLNKLIKTVKNKFYHDKIRDCAQNIRKTYKLMTEATNENITKSTIKQIKANGTIITNNREVANFCNDFFVNVGKKMAQNVKNPCTPHISKKNIASSMYLTPVNENEIVICINSLKNNCSSGPDKISSKVLKSLHMYIKRPLAHIINLIFKSGRVPQQFKETIVTPVHKAGDREIIDHYRPISVISNIAKVFEKCLKVRLTGFLDSNNILSSNQYGFRQSLSTTDAMYELTNAVVDSLDKGNKCIALFLDLAKAFDTVSHPVLLRIMEGYGIRGMVLDVFKHYLLDRTQRVRIENTLSDPLVVQYGVPQGTVIGPLLFNIYVNYLFEVEIDGTIIAYADDTVAIFCGESWQAVKEKVRMGFVKMKNIFDSLKLTVNMKKSMYVPFSITEANRPDFHEIVFDDGEETLKQTTSIKYLGVIIDSHLKWDLHVQYITRKMRYLIYKFYILKEILNQKLLKMIYKTLVESILRYGILIWGGMYTSNIKPLQIVQNYIVKIILNKPRLYSTSLLYTTEISDIRSLYILEVCNFIHSTPKIKNNIVRHNYQTRMLTNQMLNIPPSKKSINQRFVSYLGPKLFNMIPHDVRNIPNRKKFNLLLKAYLFIKKTMFMEAF